ncbi:transferrin-like [Stomoxys calcitrans]|uniref:transferrin-like n=1 Tax=Stomoxys calcitrans TaxID=35570 RepID=UPI0027E22A2C|nr:transferrin-like [Stomoxys calcitrans]
MLKFAIYLLLAAFAWGEVEKTLVFSRPYLDFYPHLGPYRLCTYKSVDYEKCVYTVNTAKSNSVVLPMECVQRDSRANCIRSVRDGSTDMTVLTGHGYKEARNVGLRPVLFAREDDSSLSIAVAPRNITVVDLHDATIYYNHSVHREFHAAVFFNLKRGHSICGFTNVNLGPYIRIEDSATYQPNDEEVLICPNRFPGEFRDYPQCNVEAGLQRAVFVRSTIPQHKVRKMQNMFETILQRFGPETSFNFLDTFSGRDNVIFKKNTIGIDLQPTYRNGVNENVFNYLHCNDDEQPHDPKSLL